MSSTPNLPAIAFSYFCSFNIPFRHGVDGGEACFLLLMQFAFKLIQISPLGKRFHHNQFHISDCIPEQTSLALQLSIFFISILLLLK